MYVQIDKLNYQYPRTNQTTINAFSLSMEKGEIVSILGPSGSGKSTILRLIAGLEIPQSGAITIGGNVIVDDRQLIPAEKREVGMVFQDYALFPHMTVAKNILFGLQKLSRKERENRLEEMLMLVQLADYRAKYPYELSGGQQQRVALARALAPGPSLLLFDEPFSNLDADLQLEIREELRKILKQTKTTSIFVTHDESDALALADKIVFIRNGQREQTLAVDKLSRKQKGLASVE